MKVVNLNKISTLLCIGIVMISTVQASHSFLEQENTIVLQDNKNNTINDTSKDSPMDVECLKGEASSNENDTKSQNENNIDNNLPVNTELKEKVLPNMNDASLQNNKNMNNEIQMDDVNIIKNPSNKNLEDINKIKHLLYRTKMIYNRILKSGIQTRIDFNFDKGNKLTIGKNVLKIIDIMKEKINNINQSNIKDLINEFLRANRYLNHCIGYISNRLTYMESLLDCMEQIRVINFLERGFDAIIGTLYKY